MGRPLDYMFWTGGKINSVNGLSLVEEAER